MMIMNCNMRNREEFIYLWEYDVFKKKQKKTINTGDRSNYFYRYLYMNMGVR